MKRIFAMFAVALLTLTACASKDAPDKSVFITDRNGVQIKLPESTDRIVSLNAATTDILIGLGYGDRIVGADYYSRATLAEEGFDISGVEEYDMMYPDAERLIALGPNVVFATYMSLISDPDVFKPAANVGIAVTVCPDSTDMADIMDDIIFVAEIMGGKTLGETLALEVSAAAEAAAEAAKAVTVPKTVYFEIADSPSLYSFGNGVFLNEFIELLGAVNIFAENDGWIAVSEETVLAKNPDIILTNINYIDDPVGSIMERAGWDAVTAVKNGDVYYIDNDASCRASQRVIKALTEMANAIYPEIFAGE